LLLYERRSQVAKIWLRVQLPDKELASLKQDFPGSELRQGDDASIIRYGCRKSTLYSPRRPCPTH